MISNARLKFLRSLRQKKVRAKEGLLLVEGLHAVAEAHRSGRAVELLLTRKARERMPGAEAVSIGEREVRALAETRTPAGAFALVENPCRPFDGDALPDRALLLLAAGVADPGNLGTLIRTSAALGVDAVVATAGTVEPTNSKVVRATAGALFRIPVLQGTVADVKRAGFGIWLADAAGTPLRELEPRPARCALVVGNEPRGVDDEVLELADATVAVPIEAGVESLNVAVAAGILLHTLVGRR